MEAYRLNSLLNLMRGDAPVARSFDSTTAGSAAHLPRCRAYRPDVCSEQRGRKDLYLFFFPPSSGFSFFSSKKKEHRDRGTICMKGAGGSAHYYLDRDGGTELF